MSEIIHSFGHGPNAAGAGPRIELEPGRYRVVASDPGVKVQHRTSVDPDREEVVMTNGHGGRWRVPQTQTIAGQECFEDFSTSGAVFAITEPTVIRFWYTDQGCVVELRSE
jgi:hypothetical protein